MKQVAQLDNEGYFVGTTIAFESPLEPGIYLIPAGAVDAEIPTVPAGARAKWVDGSWMMEEIPTPEPEPDVQPEQETLEQWRQRAAVTRAQAKAALAQAGLYEQIEAYMNDPQTPILHKIAWNDAQFFERTSPTLAALAQMLNLSDEQVDDLFRAAAEIKL